MHYPKLVIFAGYSNSGKTQFAIPILRSLGYEILSSSVLLHEFSENLLAEVFKQPRFDSYDRELTIKTNINTSTSSGIATHSQTNVSSRQFLIDLAENALVPTFSRAVFTNALADKVIDSIGTQRRFAIECFSSKELRCLCERLIMAKAYDPVFFNLRRNSENPNADSRDLIFLAPNVYNDGTYEDLELKIRQLIEAGSDRNLNRRIALVLSGFVAENT